MKRKIFPVLFIVILSLGLTSCTNAPSEESSSTETEIQSSEEEKIVWEGSAYLEAGHYSNIAGANNIFRENLVITSSKDNYATVTLCIVDNKGAVVGSKKTVAPGESVTMDEIPALSGYYMVQGSPDTSGQYYFIIA